MDWIRKPLMVPMPQKRDRTKKRTSNVAAFSFSYSGDIFMEFINDLYGDKILWIGIE